MISSEKLKKEVVEQLCWDDRVDGAQVQVEAESDGHVRLSGVVPNYQAYRAAEMDALAVRGVRAVVNELQVRYPPELILNDQEIGVSVRSSLAWYPDIDASRIGVAVESGTVTLTGTVDSLWKKIKAEELAFDTAGVVWVENELAVVPSRNIADEVIAKEIVAALERDRNFLEPDRIEVTVDQGFVTLEGSVPNWRAMAATESAARFTPGVVKVFNNLLVESTG